MAYFKQTMKIFFGVCLLLTGVGSFLYNAFMLPSGFDIPLAALGFFVFLCGLLLIVFGAARLPENTQESKQKPR